ncbi:MAG: hypothetical protein H0X39_18055 [Actinobacteria bacterium]|nr:hypothetical protein [Actinomycetota bacterium]
MAYDFDVYGLTIHLEGDWVDVVDAVRNDLVWFEAEPRAGEADVRIRIDHGTPDYDIYGDVPASFVTERNVVYSLGDRTVIDYLGHAISVLEGSSAHVTGDDPRVARRAGFDFALSRISAHLDARGMPRLHGLGLAGTAGGVVVMLPSGGGKTTLALRALREPDVTFLSEGSPVIDRKGLLHALPFPLWVRDSAPEAAGLPPEHVRVVDGELSDPRILEVAAFADRVERQPTPLAHIVLGRRSLGERSWLEPLQRRAAIPTLLRDSVVGFGFFQGAEFLLRHGLLDLRHHAGPMSTRARACRAGLRHAQVWQLTLGRDRDGNWQAFEALL